MRNHSMCSKPGSCLLAQPSTPELEVKKYLLFVSTRWVFEVHCCLHGIQADDSKLSRDHLDREPSTLLELMPLGLWNEAAPDVEVLFGPLVRPAQEDVVGHDVVVAKGGHNGNDVVVDGRMVALRLAKDLCELVDEKFILADDLLLSAGNLLVVVVAGRVASPDDKVDVVLDVVVDPLERLVDKREGRVASRRLCAVDASRAALAVAGGVLGGARIGLVEGIGMEVCDVQEAAGQLPGRARACSARRGSRRGSSPNEERADQRVSRAEHDVAADGVSTRAAVGGAVIIYNAALSAGPLYC
jgi:hypothetical protein